MFNTDDFSIRTNYAVNIIFDIVEISFPAFEGVNKKMFDYYYKRVVDIYDITDPTFVDDCYANDKLDFDLTR